VAAALAAVSAGARAVTTEMIMGMPGVLGLEGELALALAILLNRLLAPIHGGNPTGERGPTN
jgi:hypothetical protein